MKKALMIAGVVLACVAAPAMAGGDGACGGCTTSGGTTTTTTTSGGGGTTTSGGTATTTTGGSTTTTTSGGGGGGGGGGTNLVLNPGFNSVANPNGHTDWEPWNIGWYGLFKSTGFNGNTIFANCHDSSCLLPDNIIPGAPWDRCTAGTEPDCTNPYIAQAIATTAGKRYDLSFEVAEDGGPTSEFVVYWDGQRIADVVNPANNTIPYAFVTLKQPDAKDFVKFSYPGLIATTSSTTFEVKAYDSGGEIFFGNFKVTLSPLQ